MAAQPDVDQSLRLIRACTNRMCDELAALPPEGWDRATSCPPWRIRDLIGHVITSGEGHRLSVEEGVAGSVVPAVPESARQERIAATAALPPRELLAELQKETDATEAVYQRLTAEQLESICYHRRGNRSARWFVQHRLAEVAFHLWDLEKSLGREPVLDPEVGESLLPMLLESNVPRIYPSGPRGEGRFRLVVADGPGASWLLTATPERLEVERDGGAADVTITGPATVLALLIYGRADLAEEERQGRLRVEGNRALAERFNDIFRGP